MRDGIIEEYTPNNIPMEAFYLQKNTKIFINNSTCQDGYEIHVNKSSNRPKQIIKKNWNFQSMGIGGLDKQFTKLFTFAFQSRLLPPETIKAIGLEHVKGVVLYGPPGTGKTLIARQIGKMLDVSSIQVVEGPSIMNKFVGQSEENIRNLFSKAEEDLAQNGENCGIHLIIFDEFDAICRARGSMASSTNVNDTIVNQLLAKMDGVNSLPNVIVFGLTNQLELIDKALLRPGRFEVHIEIPLPTERGREEIFRIHSKNLIDNNLIDNDVDFYNLAKLTKNFSGAEIMGVVRRATQLAISEMNPDSYLQPKKLSQQNTLFHVNSEHFYTIINDTTPGFGHDKNDTMLSTKMILVRFNTGMEYILDTCTNLCKQLFMMNTVQGCILLHGLTGSGTTTIAYQTAIQSGIPYIRTISLNTFDNLNETDMTSKFHQIIRESNQSQACIIIIDSLESLIGYTEPNSVYYKRFLLSLISEITFPPKQDHVRIFIITSSLYEIWDTNPLLKKLRDCGVFISNLDIPLVDLTKDHDLTQIIQQYNHQQKIINNSLDIQIIRNVLIQQLQNTYVGVKYVVNTLDIIMGSFQKLDPIDLHRLNTIFKNLIDLHNTSSNIVQSVLKSLNILSDLILPNFNRVALRKCVDAIVAQDIQLAIKSLQNFYGYEDVVQPLRQLLDITK